MAETIFSEMSRLASEYDAINLGQGFPDTPGPREVVDAARAVLGAIDLDPASCAEANTVIQATTIYTVEDNGLERSWHGRVWMNPPYKQPDIEQFCAKFAQHVTAGDIAAGPRGARSDERGGDKGGGYRGAQARDSAVVGPHAPMTTTYWRSTFHRLATSV